MEEKIFEKKKIRKEPVIKMLLVNVELLNVREAATLESDVIRTLSKNAKVKLEGDLDNGFYPITLENGTHGYVKGEYVTIVKE